jgi:hypothetical protein
MTASDMQADEDGIKRMGFLSPEIDQCRAHSR